MIFKVALCDLVPLQQNEEKTGFVRVASDKLHIEPGSEKAKIVEAEIKKHPTALFFRAKAIKADEPNSNGDYFPESELLKSYKTFEGVPFFTNHQNENIENARGKVIYAEWDPKDKAVYTISFVDREAFPHICRSIEEEYTNGVSMGCSVEYSICNICGNKAEKQEEFCSHIRDRKARKFSGTAKNVNTGEVKTFKDQLVYEYNYGIKFIELSAVVDPACPSCRIDGIVKNDEYLKKVANIQNSLFMIKSAAIEKQAGKEEIDQLNQALKTLEDISVKLIQNRQNIEVDFASDLVGILSQLQVFVDELTGAGYGNLQDGAQNQQAAGQPQVPGVAQPPAQNQPAQLPVSEEQPLEGQPPQEVGSITGQPGKPATQMPNLPITPPVKPASVLDKIKRMADQVMQLNEQLNNHSGDNDMAKRRTISEKLEQKKVATEILSNSWQEKQDFFKYIDKVPSLQDNNNKLSVKRTDDSFIVVAENKEDSSFMKTWTYETLSDEERCLIKESPKKAALQMLNTFSKSFTNYKEGVDMSNTREAGANSVLETPDVVQEAQLEKNKDSYHKRTDDTPNFVTQKQLNEKRENDEATEVTEVQLAKKNNKLNPRTEVEADSVQEKQLETSKGASPRTNEEANEVTQSQLKNNRTNNEPSEVTEKQLDNIDTAWQRFAKRDASMFKSASEHMNAVVNTIADTVIATGCTPTEACKIAASLVASTKDRYQLLTAMLDKGSEESVDYSVRLAYWSKKNIKVAGVGSKEIAASILCGLRKVAADMTINPEVVVDAIDVVSEDETGSDMVGKAVDAKLASAKETKIKSSIKSELRQALKGKTQRDEQRKEVVASVEKKSDSGLKREAERAIWESQIAKKASAQPKADTMIDTTFAEMGITKEVAARDVLSFKKTLKTFASGALAAQNIKMAAITNVTIDGNTISIAVQTDEGSESVEIPVAGGDMGATEGDIMPEGDMAGEGLESSMPATPPPAPAPTATASAKKAIKTAQVGGAGGGIPNTPGGVAAPGAPEAGLPGGMPAGDPISALTEGDQPTEGEEEALDEIPTAGEQQPLGTICPECGTSDVDVSNEEGSINGKCKNPECGAEYEALIKKNVEYKIKKPSKQMSGETGAGAAAPEAPEVPALPVAAQTRLDKGSLKRIASNRQKHGHVCPACGMTNCKEASAKEGLVEYHCPACGTDVEKEVLINVNDPDHGILRVKWDLVPNIGCSDCQKEAKKFAAIVKVAGMMKKAEENKDKFPMANCKELIARQYGADATANYGPCKGKLLADCVCTQLEKLGLSKKRHLDKLASVYAQKDPMDECLKDQKEKGFSVKEAQNICGCLKKKFATASDSNPFMQAFAQDITDGVEKDLTVDDLDAINDNFGADDVTPVEPVSDDIDIADAIPEEDQTVTIDLPDDTAKQLLDALKTSIPEETDVDEVTIDVEPVEEVSAEIPQEGPADDVVEEVTPENEKDMAMAMQTHKIVKVAEGVVKVAGKPKVVETIEGNVEAGVPRGKATIGNEGPDNIDVKLNKPNVPRSNATMGNEVNVKADLPDVAVDSAYMGGEKETQSGMPGINNEIKGTVIAKQQTVTKEAKKMKEVETVEKDVESGVPRGKATIGNEGPDNIDVKTDKPNVPRSNAEMGNEGADNINPKADDPDVPMGDAYMGDEKAVQKGMPKNNDEILKNVQQSRDVQMERIANARRMKAVEVASKLLATARITEEAYGDVVDALSSFEIDKIQAKAEVMYPRKIKTAATQSDGEVRLASAIVMEQKEVPAVNESDALKNKLASIFTVGTKSFSDHIKNN